MFRRSTRVSNTLQSTSTYGRPKTLSSFIGHQERLGIKEREILLAMSEISKEVLISIQKKYEKARTLITEESLKDPPSEPYRSKYAAAEILQELKSTLLTLIKDIPSENAAEIKKFNAMLAAVWVGLGTISMDTEALTASGEELLTALKLLTDTSLDPVSIVVHVSSLNQLGILWSMLDQPEKSKIYLEKAEKLYLDFTNQEEVPKVCDIDDLFKTDQQEALPSESNSANPLEKHHTLTLYYLAQVYGALEDNLKSAVYCHNTLRRQLESKDYDPIDWALNSATLSQYFMERGGFKQSRHHLAAASLILDKYQDELNTMQGREEEIEAKKEQFRHRSADVARCWSKYGLLLLGASKDRLMLKASTDSEDELQTTTDLTEKPLSDKSDKNSGDGTSQLIFHSLNVASYEEQITDNFVLDFEDAVRVFHVTKQWIEEAQRYYTLEEHATDYSHIVQDLSALYQVLAFFEEDPKRQCRMHKRRLDMLEKLQSSLNAQCYLSICRQLWFELGEICWEMLHIKLSAAKDINSDGNSPDPHMLNKLNSLTTKSITYFGQFLDSLVNQGLEPGQKPFEVDMVRPALMAYFYRGRLFARIITPHKRAQLENNIKGLECYKFIVNYCTKYPEAAKVMAEELSSCKEMTELLPLKIHRLTQQLEQTSIS